MKANQLPPSAIEIHILQHLMYVCIQQQDPLQALRYGDMLHPLLSPSIS